MKLKCLVIITLIVLGCSSALAGTYAFGFLNYTGGVEYCNYEAFETGGGGNYYLQGFDVLSDCPGFRIPEIPIVGVGTTVPAAAVGGSGVPKGITGKGVYVYADDIFDAYCGCYSGELELVLTGTAVGPLKKNKWNWDILLGISGSEFLGNYGFLTATLPGAAERSNGTIFAEGIEKAKSGSLKSTVK